MPDRPGILVTRASPGAEETAERLEVLGYRPVLSPAISIVSLSPQPAVDLSGVDGLVFTSANGVRAFAEVSEDRSRRAWCVGPATEAAAGEAGFADTRCAHGDADMLVEFILARPAGKGTLLHVANDAATGKVVERLNAAGRSARFLALYTTQPTAELSPEVIAAFRSGKIQGVLVHSAKGADAFVGLADAFGLDLSTVCLLAVSERATGSARNLHWKKVHIAGAPNESALLNALRTAIPLVSG